MSNLLNHAKTLESDGCYPEAIQAYEAVIRSEGDSVLLADANFRLGGIYREWGELFAAQRFLSQAHQHDPENSDIRNAVGSLHQHFSADREAIADQLSQQNSNQIVSLFRIATGIKLVAMEKPVQAYPLMKSRTKIYPNAAVAKHLLTDISITEHERNSAIEFLIEKDWLVNTSVDLYTITATGLYAFYATLAMLHFDNDAYIDAIMCYDQAHWLDSSDLVPLYQKVLCYAALELWQDARTNIELLPPEVPAEIDQRAYFTAIAESYHDIFQETGDASHKQRVLEACEQVLRMNKKDKTISRLLNFYQAKKSWWRRK